MCSSAAGAEFASKTVGEQLQKTGVETLLIEPGSRWENGWADSSTGKLRDNLLDGAVFCTLLEAKVLTDR